MIRRKAHSHNGGAISEQSDKQGFGWIIEKGGVCAIIPHRGEMLFLDRVKNYDTGERILSAEYTVTQNCLFYDPASGGVPSWAGFECMAQAVSALSGLANPRRDGKPGIGFILSVSSLKLYFPFIKPGTTLEIRVRESGAMGDVHSFDGEIRAGEKKVLEGKLTVLDLNDGEAERFFKKP
ncbi:MAG: 3-hydroxylacyl-ACP dehydratase [Treponema sp.]|nr:3-hydroxylacyl-ACP dehydratase [Treponema sp.]